MGDLAPQLDPTVKRRVRRRQSRRIPHKAFYALVVLCAVSPLWWVMSRQPGVATRSEVKDTPAPYQAGLSLAEAGFDPPTGERHIVGTVKNGAATAFTNVTVRLRLQDLNGPSEVIEVTIPEIAAGGTAAFRTGAVPPKIERWGLAGLMGTPQAK
jgi:hypothetical protein